MTDSPRENKAEFHILTVGYTTSTGPGVAATVSFLRDEGRLVIFDPGMVESTARILDPLAELGVLPGDITDVVLSHHHPDNMLNVGLFPNADVHDHKAIYRGHEWIDREAEGHELTPSLKLIATPGHSNEDITLLAGTPEGVIALAGDIWWRPNGPADDPVAPDRSRLRASRERILAVADVIVPGHGPAFTPNADTPR